MYFHGNLGSIRLPTTEPICWQKYGTDSGIIFTNVKIVAQYYYLVQTGHKTKLESVFCINKKNKNKIQVDSLSFISYICLQKLFFFWRYKVISIDYSITFLAAQNENDIDGCNCCYRGSEQKMQDPTHYWIIQMLEIAKINVYQLHHVCVHKFLHVMSRICKYSMCISCLITHFVCASFYFYTDWSNDWTEKEMKYFFPEILPQTRKTQQIPSPNNRKLTSSKEGSSESWVMVSIGLW